MDKRVLTVVASSAVLAIAPSQAIAAKPTPAVALKAGTYSGTVTMPVTVGTGTYQARLTGTWRLTVSKTDRVTGSESMHAVIAFTSPDANGCTYSPTSWTLGFLAGLGTDTLTAGTPGTVKGAKLVISLSNNKTGGWSGAPAQYTRTCGSFPNTWPIGLQYGFGPRTGAPLFQAVQFPLSFFKTRGKPYSLQVTTVEKATLTQTYVLTNSP